MPDLLCLQEVSTKTAYPFFIHELQQLGYTIIECKQVEQQRKEPVIKNHPRYWELLTAYNSERFRLIEKLELDLYQVGKDYKVPMAAEYRKQNKAIVLLLQSIENANEKVVLVNTQLYKGDDQDYVRQA